MSEVAVVDADLADPAHQRAIIEILNAYAQDPIIGGEPLSDDVQGRLISGLQSHPTTVVLLAYLDEQPVGIAVCFLGFSTFAAKPLLNLHDLAVHKQHRSAGVGRALLAAVEDKARQLDCCKVTLEVLEVNQRARQIYEAVGYRPSVEDPNNRTTYFLSKPLETA